MSFLRSMGPLPVAVAVASGIAIAPALDDAAIPVVARALAAAVLAVLAVLAVRRGRRSGDLAAAVAIGLACAAAGAARGARAPIEPPPGVTVDDRVVDRVVGIVGAPVVRTRRGFGALVEPSAGDAVWCWTEVAVAPGETIAVHGLARTPRGALGPGAPDRRDALLSRGARLELVARRVERLADDPGPGARLWRWAAATQARWARRIDEAGGAPGARAALRGIVVGDRLDVPPELDARWRAVGIYHVLSVSGLHLAVVAGLAFALLRRAIAASPIGGRVRAARWAAPPALVLAVAYTVITGGQLATLRALVVIVLVWLAAMLDRPVRLVDALGVAAILLLAWRPADLLDPSFQLSFTAALALAVTPRIARTGVTGWIVRGIVTSAWVTIATAPITAYHFQQVTPGGVLGNLVLTPVVELVALPLALGGLAIGWDAPIELATWLVAQVDAAAALVAHVMPIGRIALAGGGVLAALVALSLGLAARRRRTRADVIAWIALCLAWPLGRMPPGIGELRVTFVDVGQGDAAIVELPDGAVWLIDAGGHASARDVAAASAPGRTVTRTLGVYGHDRVDLAIVSHPHPDHYLGLAALDVPVTELWSIAQPAPPPTRVRATGLPSFEAIAQGLAARGTRLVHPPLGVARAQAGVELVVWAPRFRAVDDAPWIQAADPVRSVNDNSLVVEVRYRGRSLLFTGDLEVEGEEELVEALVEGGLGPVDVVKVAHHGSPTSSTPRFVTATRPAVAVISCGRANQFRFPAPEIVARWRAAGADVARTDVDGAITVVVDAAGRLAVQRFAPAVP